MEWSVISTIIYAISAVLWLIGLGYMLFTMRKWDQYLRRLEKEMEELDKMNSIGGDKNV